MPLFCLLLTIVVDRRRKRILSSDLLKVLQHLRGSSLKPLVIFTSAFLGNMWFNLVGSL